MAINANADSIAGFSFCAWSAKDRKIRKLELESCVRDKVATGKMAIFENRSDPSSN